MQKEHCKTETIEINIQNFQLSLTILVHYLLCFKFLIENDFSFYYEKRTQYNNRAYYGENETKREHFVAFQTLKEFSLTITYSYSFDYF